MRKRSTEAINPAETEKIYDHFFVARQPILYENCQIWGYELLFRAGPEYDMATIKNQDIATFSVATCGFIRSQEDLDQTKKICINFTEKLLLDGAPQGLPPAVTVIEVLEDVLPSNQLVELLIQYKQDGYLVAIDDYEGGHEIDELLSLADIIKVDILNKSVSEIQAVVDKISDYKAVRIAEKVEDRSLLPALKQMGFTLYQGYYFAKPELLEGRKIGANEVSKLRVLQIVEDSASEPEDIERVIAADPSITYRLLRFLNSAAFGFSIQIKSIRHAVTLLGIKRLKNWLRMAILSDLLGNKTQELYIMALNRGKLLEELANEDKIPSVGADTMFLFGLLSLMEAMLDMPMPELISQLPIPDEIKQGYVDPTSEYNKYLQLLSAIEQSSADQIQKLCKELMLGERSVADASLRSTVWANEMCQYIL